MKGAKAMTNKALGSDGEWGSAAQPSGKARRLWKEIKKNRTSYYFMSGYLLLFALFTVIPVLISIVLSFTYFNVLERPRFIGLDNYVDLFLRDEVFLIAIKNTFLFSAITGPISYIMCLLFAWLINELPPKIRAFMTLLFYAPSISGAAFMVWTVMFSGDAYGYANAFLLKAGMINEPVQWFTDPQYMMPLTMIVILWLSLGTSFLAFIAGLQGVDRSLYEAGAIDGIRNRVQELWFITLPAIRPQLLFGAVMSITGSFGIGTVLNFLVGYPSTDYAVHTVVNHLEDYGSIRFEMGYASAIATVLFLVMIFTNQLVQKLLRKVGQ